MKQNSTKHVMRICNVLFLSFLFISQTQAAQHNVIDLSGHWQLFVDLKKTVQISQMKEVPFDDTITLPGTLDQSQKGNKNEVSSYTGRLSRKYSFYGKAWYRKEVTIPADWTGKKISLHLERTRVTHLWVDTIYVGSSLVISSAQQYDLTAFLSPGKHTLTIVVDNGDDCGLPSVVKSSHMWTDETQTIWNGIVGEMVLQAKDPLHIVRVKSEPDIAKKSVKLSVFIDNSTGSSVKGTLDVAALLFNSKEKQEPLQKEFGLEIQQGENVYTIEYELGKEALLWSEFAPNLYKLNLSLFKEKNFVNDTYTLTVGLRDFTTEGKYFTINGLKTFLRGKHDACVFPLTGYAPMNVNDWMRYFKILRSYGFNHVRYHSWCPPEAAFEAADLCGFYLQPELPIWSTVYDSMENPVSQFLLREAKGVMDEFGNHASFVMFSTGNEIGGMPKAMKFMTDAFRKYDNRFLFALGTNYHLGWSGGLDGEDFLVTCRVGGGDEANYETHVRSSFAYVDALDGGALNGRYPNTKMDYSKGSAKSPKPVVGHEVGQFQMYPDPKEIKKYTGVLYPHNLVTFINRTNEKHGVQKTERFFQASAALSLLCYKADLEMALRTPNFAGYQMLDIQDFPGQGTALVGVLDAFMESKGIITPEDYSQFNAPVIPLWVSDSYTWMNDTVMSGNVKIFNYSADDLNAISVDWQLVTIDGKIIKNGTIKGNAKQGQLTDLAVLNIDLSDIKQASQLQLRFAIRNTSYANEYNTWVYPRQKAVKLPSSVRLFTAVDKKLYNYLQKGGTALVIPKADEYKEQTVGGLFTSDYWSFSMFKRISENAKKPVSPGTLGYLIHNEHPLFKEFPTDFHSDWQWWAITRNARPLIMDNLSSPISPIVEAIDNVERNHKLAVMFECKVGKGKLFVCMSDLINHQNYKECNQLYGAICRYVSSKEFNPADELSVEQLQALFYAPVQKAKIEGVKNVSYE